MPPIPSHGDRVHPNTQPSPSAPTASSSQNLDRGGSTFGVDLAEQMARDNVELPPIMEKCCQAIEKYGIRSQGIYRINGTSRKVTQLKEKLDKGSPLLPCFLTGCVLTISLDLSSVNLDANEWSADINNVTSAIKSWFRELPDPVLTLVLHQGFIDAASKPLSTFPAVVTNTELEIENDRLRHIRLHERVNDLPDPNYATLKYFLGHLYRYVNYSARSACYSHL